MARRAPGPSPDSCAAAVPVSRRGRQRWRATSAAILLLPVAPALATALALTGSTVNAFVRCAVRAALAAASLLVACAAPAAAASFSTPALLTSSGQSADVAIVKALLRAHPTLDLAYKPAAQPADLAGMKTLIVVLGASTKGLGAAGLDMGRELARTRAILKAARDGGLRILAMHVGGAGRRGRTSDDLIAVVVPEADWTIVVASGDRDKLFDRLAAKRGAPVVEVEKAAAAAAAAKALFAGRREVDRGHQGSGA